MAAEIALGRPGGIFDQDRQPVYDDPILTIAASSSGAYVTTSAGWTRPAHSLKAPTISDAVSTTILEAEIGGAR